jgi:hypothetical protein
MEQDGSLDAQNHSIDLNALSGSGELTVIGDGNNVVNVKSDLSASTVGGINVDNGNFYVNAGKTPNGPLKIAGGAQLQLAGDHNATASQVTGSLMVDAGGIVVVDAGKKVGAVLAETLTYNFDPADGYFKSGSNVLPWPTNFKSYQLGLPGQPGQSAWVTDDTSDEGVSYGGQFVNFDNSNSSGLGNIYKRSTGFLSSVSPTITNDSNNDVALTGAVSMHSGSKIQLEAGATWARNVTVTA